MNPVFISEIQTMVPAIVMAYISATVIPNWSDLFQFMDDVYELTKCGEPVPDGFWLKWADSIAPADTEYSEVAEMVLGLGEPYHKAVLGKLIDFVEAGVIDDIDFTNRALVFLQEHGVQGTIDFVEGPMWALFQEAI